MTVERLAEDEQWTLWNGPSGRAWVDTQDVLDSMFKPLEELLVQAVSGGSRRQVLDVGCGTGSATLAVARWLGASGHCTGIDISEPMLTRARARAEQEGSRASFLRANAQDHAFAPASFDLILSRFGVMFFKDSVQAFANLRRAARDGADLRFIAWRGPADNPFMTTAERAAAPLLPDIPARRLDGPGAFAFADPDRVHRILEDSGWAGIDIQPLDVVCTLPEKELVRYMTRVGPLGLKLHEAEARTRLQVIDTVRAAFEPYVHGADVRFTAACWWVGARAGCATAPSPAGT
jgi:SAM-dependent methyltransferase